MALSREQYPDYPYSRGKSRLKDILVKRQRKASSGVLTKKVNQLPEDLIIEILSRLPVKTLLQFKCVCKSWYAMIKSSHFVSKQLRNYYVDNNNWRDCLLVQYSVTQAGELNVYELLIDDKKNRVLSYQEISTPVYNTYLCGPCHGIYYLWCFCVGTRHSMWNPALNKFKVLPDITWKPNIPPDYVYIRESYGFGYDSKTDDYKVILIMYYCDTRDDDPRSTDYPRSILVYSLRSNSWRYWGDGESSYDLEQSKSYDFVNGSYYWLGSRLLNDFWDYGVVISFDIAADVYQVIPLPQFEDKPEYGSQLVIYHDSIAFVSVLRYNTEFCVWSWSEGVRMRKLKMKFEFKVWGSFSHWRIIRL